MNEHVRMLVCCRPVFLRETQTCHTGTVDGLLAQGSNNDSGGRVLQQHTAQQSGALSVCKFSNLLTVGGVREAPDKVCVRGKERSYKDEGGGQLHTSEPGKG